MSYTKVSVNSPLVSVVIPTYGRAELLHRCIMSVCTQTYENLEIIVVDDNGLGSPAQIETEQVVASIKDNRIVYIPHKTNKNGSAARNTGANIANGDYLCFLDDDDVFLPIKIEAQMNKLGNHHFCICGVKKIDRNTGAFQEFAYSEEGDILEDVLLYRKDFCSGDTLLVRKECFIDINGFDEKLKRSQDYNFLAKLSAKYTAIVIPNVLVEITLHDRTFKPEQAKKYELNVQAFLNSIENILTQVPKALKKKTLRANYCLVMKQALLNKNLKLFIKYAVKIGNPLFVCKILVIDTIRYIKRNRKNSK